ncbi:glycerate kinase [Chitinimonas lacunae]|uniref:Glycerate kinase n=1 Tax=Chitinimonas lacunae TaxID=1963018 RepID=A0ABV8MJ66_9NEIS
MRVVLAPDSFKNCLEAAQVAEALAIGLRRVWPGATLLHHPLADGGEGTLAALAAAVAADWREAEVPDLEGHVRRVRWLHCPDATVVLESAEMLGLGLSGSRPVAARDSGGLGLLLRQALDAGARRIAIGLGGTGSNDGGIGLLRELGARPRDAQGASVAPGLAGLADLAQLDLAGLDPRLAQVELIALADVASPLCGPDGATAVFGPQKGVRPAEIERFDGWLARLGQLGDAACGQNYSTMPGSGAAGGLGWALRLLGARIEAGAEWIADRQGLDASLAGADWVLTGEGRSDRQTTLGKAPWRLAARAARLGVPVSLLSGSVDPCALPELSRRFAGCFSLCPGPVGLDEARTQATDWLADRAETMARLWQAARSGQGILGAESWSRTLN